MTAVARTQLRPLLALAFVFSSTTERVCMVVVSGTLIAAFLARSYVDRYKSTRSGWVVSARTDLQNFRRMIYSYMRYCRAYRRFNTEGMSSHVLLALS